MMQGRLTDKMCNKLQGLKELYAEILIHLWPALKKKIELFANERFLSPKSKIQAYVFFM